MCYSLPKDKAFIEQSARISALSALLDASNVSAERERALAATALAGLRSWAETELAARDKLLKDAESEMLKAVHLTACLPNVDPRVSERSKFRLRSSAELVLRKAHVSVDRGARRKLIDGAVDAVVDFKEETHGGVWSSSSGCSKVCTHEADNVSMHHWSCCGKTDKGAACTIAHPGEWRQISSTAGWKRFPAGSQIKEVCSTVKSSASEGFACYHAAPIAGRASHWSCCGSTKKHGGDMCELFFPVHAHELKPTPDDEIAGDRVCSTCFSPGDGHFASCKMCNYVRVRARHSARSFFFARARC